MATTPDSAPFSEQIPLAGPLAEAYSSFTMPPTEKLERHYYRLSHAFVLLADAIRHGGPDPATIMDQSFSDVVAGLAVQKGLILLPLADQPGRFDVFVHTPLVKSHQVEALRDGRSVKGVSASVVERVMQSLRPEIIEHPILMRQANKTAALDTYDYSVLCVPVVSLDRTTVRAVYYLQTAGTTHAYRESDLHFLHGFVELLEILYDQHQRAQEVVIPSTGTYADLRREWERQLLSSRLATFAGKRKPTRDSLDMSHSRFYRLINALGLKLRGDDADEDSSEPNTGAPAENEDDDA